MQSKKLLGMKKKTITRWNGRDLNAFIVNIQKVESHPWLSKELDSTMIKRAMFYAELKDTLVSTQ
jgi:hypothetical protein